jgi:hypothetical protein
MLRTPPSPFAGASRVALENVIKFHGFKGITVEFRALLGAVFPPPGGTRPAAGTNGAHPRPEGDLSAAVPGWRVTRRAGAAAGEGHDEALDPLARSLAGPCLAAAPGVVPPLAAAAAPAAGAVGTSIAELSAIEEAVRRVAWGGDRRRGVARIELGGEHTGSAIVVHGEGRSVALSLESVAGARTAELAERLLERLRARGLDVTGVDVR